MRKSNRLALSRRAFAGGLAAGFALAPFAPATAQIVQNSLDPSDATWLSIRDEIFNGRQIEDGTALMLLETPVRAQDAAIVPITLRAKLAEGDERTLQRFTVVIDENPAPLAVAFNIGPDAGLSMISTRMRVNSYSYIRAIMELSDGRLYMTKNFVKASGGCSAPALKDADAARADVGLLKLRQFGRLADNQSSPLQEAQIMVRHPNNSGLQMDQVTRLYIPAYFVRDLKIWQNDDLIFAAEGGISLSENPSVRFNFLPRPGNMLRAEARDTADQLFRAEWPVEDKAI